MVLLVIQRSRKFGVFLISNPPCTKVGCIEFVKKTIQDGILVTNIVKELVDGDLFFLVVDGFDEGNEEFLIPYNYAMLDT